MKCRHCDSEISKTMADLRFAPPSNAYLTEADLHKPEIWFPLRIMVCEQCWLVQTEDYSAANGLFTQDYAYFSSTSSSWLAHAKRFCDDIIRDLKLNKNHQVVEIACNDGYLLKNFVEAQIPCLGIEPTASTAEAAKQLNIPVIGEFFGNTLAQKMANDGIQANLIVANNVYAHVPDINDFTQGLKTLLKPQGTITLEFQHVLNILKFTQFDTLYHEHFSYHSLHAVNSILFHNQLRVYRVVPLSTHGGSLRVYICHQDDPRITEASVTNTLKEEAEGGITRISTYTAFQARVEAIKTQLQLFLLELKTSGKSIAAYGAAAKGNTLLNYAGVTPDLLPFVCDAAPSKQRKFMPGSHIPIVAPGVLEKYKPDFLLILPWNIADEIKTQLDYLRKSGTRFITAIPELREI